MVEDTFAPASADGSVENVEDIVDKTVDENRAPVLVSPRTRRRSQVKRKLRIPNLQQLEVLEPQQFIVTIPDPFEDGDVWDIVVQELSPGQLALLQQTAFARNADAARRKLDALDLDPDDDSPETQEKIRELMGDSDTQQTVHEYQAYKVEVCMLGIVEPEGLTREIIEKWAPGNVDKIYSAIMEGATAVDAVDAFPSQDTRS